MMLDRLVMLLVLAGAAGCARGADLDAEAASLLAEHRAARDAHFRTDVDLLLASAGDSFVTVSAGKIHRVTRDEERAQFTSYFRNATYYEWDDLEPPIVRVSGDASMAWMIVRTRVRRSQRLPGGDSRDERFVYAGIMTYEKKDGRWVRVANVSTFE
jgi:hypothetical protein